MVRSAGGEGAVTLLWQLEHGAVDDLSPLNGTVIFTQVKYRTTNRRAAVPCCLSSFFVFLNACSSSCKGSHEAISVFMLPQNQSTHVIVIRALADAVLEGDEHFSVRLFPAEIGAVIDPLNGERASAFTH